MEDMLYTIDEVSKYLKIPKSTLYKLSQKGRMPSVKIGKQLRFRKSSIDNWLSQKECRQQEPQPANPLTRKPAHILLIDDDTLVLKAVSKLLQYHGYNVMAVASGQEALDKIKDTAFDLVITDVRMPGLDGIETIKRIREFNRTSGRPDGPEMVITGFTDTDAERKAQELGITDYVYKPFSNIDFLKTVERKLEFIDN